MRKWIIAALMLVVTLSIGCASQTAAVKDMHTTSTEAGYPMTTVMHAEASEQGLHLQVGPDNASLFRVFLGSQDYFGNFTTAPLGEDAFIWQHVNRLGAASEPINGEIHGSTTIRVDQPAYLGPLRW